jgi:hypothetical protein
MQQDRRTITVETVRSRLKAHRPDMKPKRWSHQDELDAMIGKEVCVTFLHGDPGVSWIKGMLVAADAFTLQLAVGNKSVMTYFKHGILYYNLAMGV